jgi:hypothetical protein
MSDNMASKYGLIEVWVISIKFCGSDAVSISNYRARRKKKR